MFIFTINNKKNKLLFYESHKQKDFLLHNSTEFVVSVNKNVNDYLSN